jgi:DNA-binding MurR/RpiR family transcriptional regulator
MQTSSELLRADMAAKRDALSPRLRQLAEFALCHPNDMALETIAVIAERAGVPPSSLIRFANAFGYDGFSAMQRVFRTQLVERTTDYAERIQALRRSDVGTTPAAILDLLAEAGMQALDHLRGSIRPERLEEAADLLAGAEAIHVVGQRRAFAVATYLAYAFGQLGQRTHLLDGVGGMTLHQANFITAKDVLVVVSFAPYAPETLAVAHRADERGVPLIVLTDGPLSPLLPLARVSFEVQDAELQGFRSLSATMCLALALVVGLGQRREESGRMRRPGSQPKRVRSPSRQTGAPRNGFPADEADAPELSHDPAE